MTEQQHEPWAKKLIAWFKTHRRDLPWRTDSPRDPYKVWVSEIMLQQTKVEAARPYYEHWIEQFPTIKSLAEASQDDVLKAWQGLGYYSRARNLHEAVQEVEAHYGGKVPDTKEEIRKLKGVGEYTAGAILSIAYGKDEVAVDGNVLRVFARLYNIKENVLSGPTKKKITKLAEDNLLPHTGAIMCEALMDFGAMICIPKSPHCDQCPLQDDCQAYAAGTAKELPVRVTKKKVPTEAITVVVIEEKGRWLIHRRPEKGMLASMWEFPNVIGKGPQGRQNVADVLQGLGLTVSVKPKKIGTLKHIFSHKIWNMTIYEGHVMSGTLRKKEDWQWLRVSDYATVPWAGPHGKITAMV